MLTSISLILFPGLIEFDPLETDINFAIFLDLRAFNLYRIIDQEIYILQPNITL